MSRLVKFRYNKQKENCFLTLCSVNKTPSGLSDPDGSSRLLTRQSLFFNLSGFCVFGGKCSNSFFKINSLASFRNHLNYIRFLIFSRSCSCRWKYFKLSKPSNQLITSFLFKCVCFGDKTDKNELHGYSIISSTNPCLTGL